MSRKIFQDKIEELTKKLEMKEKEAVPTEAATE
jgi:hypothetical protein